MQQELEPLIDSRPDDLEEMLEDTSHTYKVILAIILVLIMIIGYTIIL